jgi:RimJ/RimL family protein N-acetyltransferase
LRSIVTRADHIVGPWIAEHTGGQWHTGQGSTIAIVENGKILGATLYQNFNGASIMMHCAGLGRSWLTREFLWFAFYYPFEQLAATKIISPVESNNVDSIRFIKHIGFTLEATLVDASPHGDLHLFTMTKDQCKWLNLKDRKPRVQTQSTRST